MKNFKNPKVKQTLETRLGKDLLEEEYEVDRDREKSKKNENRGYKVWETEKQPLKLMFEKKKPKSDAEEA